MTGDGVDILAVDSFHVCVLENLHRDGFDAPWSAQAFTGLLNLPTVCGWIVATPDPVGFILIQIAADECEVLTLAVRALHRRAGLGQCLLDKAEDYMRLAGIKTCHLEVAADNIAALSLYSEAGYRQTGRRAGYYSRPQGAVDARLMSKNL